MKIGGTRVLPKCMKKALVLSYPLSKQYKDPDQTGQMPRQADLNFCGAKSHLFVSSHAKLHV